MHLTNDAVSYVSYNNAVKALDKALMLVGRNRDNVRWLISVTDTGRYVPTLVGTDHEYLLLAMHGRCAVVS